MADPTGISLPGLVHNVRTRVGGEFHIYYNPGCVYYHGMAGYDGSNPVFKTDAACGSICNSIPVSGVGAVRNRVCNASGDTDWTVGVGLEGTIPPYSPPGQSAEVGEIASVELADISVVGAVAGDSVDIVTLPNPANDVLICYAQSFNKSVGDENRPIARKFNTVDHYVRQRPENSLTINDMYISNLDGLAYLRQRDVTLIVKVFPDDGAVASEIMYFSQCRLNIPMEVPEEANDSVSIAATGFFKHDFVFTGRPA